MLPEAHRRNPMAVTGRSYSYRDAGVDIDKGNAFVERIKPYAKATARTGTEAKLGGFGGLFDLAAAGWRDPVLVGAADGVGTKLMVAHEAGCHEGIGIDLVAMCVNDLVVQGAEPLFFLDYYATGALSVEGAAVVVKSVADGCRRAKCALIGGETAEMPGFYDGGHYDLAGFAVGAVEREDLLPRNDSIRPGDVLIGLASNGVHANGFSLVRRLVDVRGLDYSAPSPFDSRRTLGEWLLEPSAIYVQAVHSGRKRGGINALAHITGGGLQDNLVRVLGNGIGAEIDLESWIVPPVFEWMAAGGNVTHQEILRTFNCGIGMVAVVAKEQADSVAEAFSEYHEVFRIGEITDGASVSCRGKLPVWECDASRF